MRRYIKIAAIAIMTFASSQVWSQSVWDAYKYSQQFNEGTARSAAMGNAMVALGGDIGALSINPATSAVYRYHELVFTPSLTIANSSTNYNTPDNGIFSSNENKTRFGVPNFGYIGSFETGRKNHGLINLNVGLAFNRVNNFTSRMSAGGRTAKSSWLASLAQNTNGIHAQNMDMNDHTDPFFNSTASWTSILGWNTTLLDTLPDSPIDYIGATENINGYNIAVGGDLDQHYTKETLGNISEAVINFGGNISNKFFFGINIGIQSIWYKYSETYSETAVNASQFQSGFSSFSHHYKYSTSGTGVNLKAGIIYLPVKGLRIGASISTPTWMYLHEEWDERMSSNFTDGYSQKLMSPLGVYDYRLNTPFRWNVGLAYTLKQIGVISVDYENVNYSKTKLKDPDNGMAFTNENNEFIQNFGSSDIIRAGLEIRFMPQATFRAGYQYYTSGYNYDKTNIQIGSIGLGYASPNGFFADIAYQQYLKKSEEIFSLYDDIVDGTGNVISAAPVGTTKYNTGKLLISLGVRF